MKNNHFAVLLPFVGIMSALLISACGLIQSPSTVDRTPEESITQAANDYLGAQGAPMDQFEVQIKQIDGDYARVEIISTDPESPGGWNAFMKQTDGIWATVISGSGMELVQVESLGIPESVWPEAWLSPAIESEPPAGQVDPESSTACPQATDGSLVLTDNAHGLCLLYPASHTVLELDSGNTEIVVGDIMNHIDPRVSIYTEELAGRTMEQVVDEFLSGYEGFEIEQTSLTVAGEEAVLLDRIPGQDFYRKVLVIHDGRLFHLSFAPYDDSLGDNFGQAQQLYGLVMDSFQFTTP